MSIETLFELILVKGIVLCYEKDKSNYNKQRQLIVSTTTINQLAPTTNRIISVTITPTRTPTTDRSKRLQDITLRLRESVHPQVIYFRVVRGCGARLTRGGWIRPSIVRQKKRKRLCDQLKWVVRGKRQRTADSRWMDVIFPAETRLHRRRPPYHPAAGCDRRPSAPQNKHRKLLCVCKRSRKPREQNATVFPSLMTLFWRFFSRSQEMQVTQQPFHTNIMVLIECKKWSDNHDI